MTTLAPPAPEIITKPLTEEEQALLKAADYIEKVGWTVRVVENSYGNVCAMGSINYTVTGCATVAGSGRLAAFRDRVAMILDSYLTAIGEYRWVAEWNDDEERTQDEVVAAMRAAALWHAKESR